MFHNLNLNTLSFDGSKLTAPGSTEFIEFNGEGSQRECRRLWGAITKGIKESSISPEFSMLQPSILPFLSCCSLKANLTNEMNSTIIRL